MKDFDLISCHIDGSPKYNFKENKKQIKILNKIYNRKTIIVGDFNNTKKNIDINLKYIKIINSDRYYTLEKNNKIKKKQLDHVFSNFYCKPRFLIYTLPEKNMDKFKSDHPGIVIHI